jgi:hypothetical protein
MPDRNATDLRLGRDAHPPDEPTPADHGDQVAVAPDGGAGGWEAFDDPDAPEPRPATTPDRPERPTATVTPAPDGGAGGWEAFDDPNAPTDEPAERSEITPILELSEYDSWGRPESLPDHFDRHGSDLRCTSDAEYAYRASEFLQRSQAEGLPTKIDPTDGTIRVYDPDTNTFGSYNADGTTKTFYKPDPERHGYDSNWQYWDDQQGNSPSIPVGRSIG